MPESSYPRFTSAECHLTDLDYLAGRYVADTHEARTILTELTSAGEKERIQQLYQFVHRLAQGNGEAERLFRLLRSREPYTTDVFVAGAWTQVIAETPEMAALRPILNDLFKEE